jgi:hypothetical protein
MEHAHAGEAGPPAAWLSMLVTEFSIPENNVFLTSLCPITGTKFYVSFNQSVTLVESLISLSS